MTEGLGDSRVKEGEKLIEEILLAATPVVERNEGVAEILLFADVDATNEVKIGLLLNSASFSWNCTDSVNMLDCKDLVWLLSL